MPPRLTPFTRFMNWFFYGLLGLAGMTLIANFLATRALVRDAGTTQSQKLFQLLIVWCLPLIGAMLVVTMLSHHYSKAELADLGLSPFAYRDVKKNDQNHGSGQGACGAGGDGLSCGGSCGSD